MSIGDVKRLIFQTCLTLETDALAPTRAAAQIAHAERNVLRVGLDGTSRRELVQTMNDLSVVFDDLESCAERLQLVIQEFRAYARSL